MSTIKTPPPAQVLSLQQLADQAFERGKAAHAANRETAEKAQASAASCQELLSYSAFGTRLIEDLLKTPRARDAGKYGRAAWFADSNWNPIRLRDGESPPPDAKSWDEAWNEAGHDDGKIRIVTYHQTFDSPEGDTWQACYYHLDPNTLFATRAKASREEEHRFM